VHFSSLALPGEMVLVERLVTVPLGRTVEPGQN
jgi:hypothetical protein